MKGGDVITILRAHEAELHDMGIRQLSLFGSVARGDDSPDSDVDLAAVLSPGFGTGFAYFGRLERVRRHLSRILRRDVDLVPEPVRRSRLQSEIDRDRIRAF